jgi:hypothetical protein
MAARRLLILMLMLLAVSTLAAALIPPDARRQGTTSTTSTTTAPTSDATGGRLIERTVRVAGKGSRPIAIRLGDQLALTVSLGFVDQVEIPAFGVLEDAAPGAPARFDLLPDRTGHFDVELVEAGRVVAEITVARKRGGSTR